MLPLWPPHLGALMIADTLSADLVELDVFRAMQSLIVSLTTSLFVVAASLHWPGKGQWSETGLSPSSFCKDGVGEGRGVQEKNKRGTTVMMCFPVLPKISVKSISALPSVPLLGFELLNALANKD